MYQRTNERSSGACHSHQARPRLGLTSSVRSLGWTRDGKLEDSAIHQHQRNSATGAHKPWKVPGTSIINLRPPSRPVSEAFSKCITPVHSSYPRTHRPLLTRHATQGGRKAYYSGLAPRLCESSLSGALLLAGNEGGRRLCLRAGASPVIAAVMGGVGGGLAQAMVMAPTSMLVTVSNVRGVGWAVVLREVGLPCKAHVHRGAHDRRRPARWGMARRR